MPVKTTFALGHHPLRHANFYYSVESVLGMFCFWAANCQGKLLSYIIQVCPHLYHIHVSSHLYQDGSGITVLLNAFMILNHECIQKNTVINDHHYQGFSQRPIRPSFWHPFTTQNSKKCWSHPIGRAKLNICKINQHLRVCKCLTICYTVFVYRCDLCVIILAIAKSQLVIGCHLVDWPVVLLRKLIPGRVRAWSGLWTLWTVSFLILANALIMCDCFEHSDPRARWMELLCQTVQVCFELQNVLVLSRWMMSYQDKQGVRQKINDLLVVL